MNTQQIATAVADDPALVGQYWPLIVAGLERFGINDHLTRVATAATVATECDFRWLTELASGEEYNGRADLGNTQPGDGPRYKGRGFVQTTGRAEYDATGKAIGVDLLNNPEQAADPHIAALSLAYYFKSHGIQTMANAQDWRAVRRTVNGGYNGWDRFIACITNLLALPDSKPVYVTTVGTAGALKTKPDHVSPVAIGPDHKPVALKVGAVVTFTPDPHTKQEVTPEWAHVAVAGTPEHGWFLRAALRTIEKS